MSETTGTVIKLLSALTSPKASVKYISMAVFLVVSWKYLNEKLVSYGAPAEHLSLIVLLIGLGAGSLVGQIIYSIVAFAWDKVENAIEEKKKAKARAETMLEHKRVVDAKNEQFLERFKKVFPHYFYWKKDALRSLVGGAQSLESRLVYVSELYSDRYILNVGNIDSDRKMYEINPVIRDYVDIEWQQEIERNMVDFFEELTPQKQDLLRVMTFTGIEFYGPIDLATVQLLKPLHPCFGIECEDGDGFYISFRIPYNTHFTDKTGIDFADEVYIRHEWIQSPHD